MAPGTSLDRKAQADPPVKNPAVISGAVAGVVECLAVQPLDMIKTRFQLMTGPAVERPTVVSAMQGLLSEGGVKRLYRGIIPELVAMTPKSSAMYGTYHGAANALRPLMTGRFDSDPCSDPSALHFAAGICSGVPEAAIVTPFQVVKVRMQAREHLGRYNSTLHCLRTVVAEEGVLALTAGFHVTAWRNSIWNSVYFGTMHALRRSRLFGGGEGERDRGSVLLETLRTASFGFAAGVFATCFNAPFDVVKSRVQAARGSSAGPLHAKLRSILLEEGVAGLYAGFAPKAMRMGLGGAVGIGAFELTMKILGDA